MKALIFSFLNFGILLAFLFWKARKPFFDYVAQRAADFRRDVESVAELLHRAKGQNDEFAAKLKAIEAEVVSMRQAARADADVSRKHIIEEARRLAVVIVADSRRSAEAAGADLKGQLRAELAVLVIASAESQIRSRLTSDDRKRIRSDFSRQVETVA